MHWLPHAVQDRSATARSGVARLDVVVRSGVPRSGTAEAVRPARSLRAGRPTGSVAHATKFSRRMEKRFVGIACSNYAPKSAVPVAPKNPQVESLPWDNGPS